MNGNKLSIHCASCVFNINDNCLRHEDSQVPCRFEEVMKYERKRDIYEQLCKECEKRRNNNA
jgi:hypothetical protein